MDTNREMGLDLHRRQLQGLNKFKLALGALLAMKLFHSKEEFDGFRAKMEKAEKGDAKALGFIRKKMQAYMRVATDAMSGTLDQNDFYNRHKTASVLAGPGTMPTIIQNFNIFAGDFDIDMQWMLLYANKDMRQNLTGKVSDFKSAVKFKKLTKDEAVPYGFIGDSTGTSVSKDRIGGGLAFERMWLERNGFITANEAMQAIRVAHEVFKSEDAFTTLTQNIGVTQTFSTDLQTTLNTAYAARLDALQANGYGLTDSTPMYLVHNHAWKQQVNKAIFALRGENGTSPVVEYNILPISTHLVPKQLKENNTGTAHDAVLLMVPGRNCMYLPFDDPSENEAFKWDTDQVKMGLQDWYKFRVGDKNQLVKVRLS